MRPHGVCDGRVPPLVSAIVVVTPDDSSAAANLGYVRAVAFAIVDRDAVGDVARLDVGLHPRPTFRPIYVAER